MNSRSEEQLTYPEGMVNIIRDGLQLAKTPKKVIIAGAGMSGLVSASLLKRAGHHVTVLEGNDRIGGRVFTLRQPFTQGNYIELGAMRIPGTHALVCEYIKRFRLPINPFINSSPLDLIFVNNILTTRKHYEQYPEVLQFPLEEWEKGKTASELFLSAVNPFIERYQSSSPEEQGRLKKQYASYSMRDYLENNPLGPSLSSNAIRMIMVLLGIEGFPEFSFVDILTDIIYPIFNKDTNFYEITGGNDQLPLSFLSELHSDILYNHKVRKIKQTTSGVTLSTVNPLTQEPKFFSGDYSIITMPFSVFQFVDVEPYDSISFKKWQAIRTLPNIPAVKIAIEFKHRFWERMKVGNIITDLPTMFTYIPSHNKGRFGPAVLLGSYSWGNNASLWTSLTESSLISYVLKDLAKIYGNIVYQEYYQAFAFDWAQNPFSAGCFTLFSPHQVVNFGDYISTPEGRLHFAGEHTSSFHGWVEGAIESGIRAAYEINERSRKEGG
ncbi:flavin monoamine oxidase family protein [Halobacillus amylolyticus]|uniref:Flavin monoamine oxidase family protein n=1 Tax=Halobacillus amylolyticus TaxID=2932259 RepID=A0ABY4HDR8_9BACI|nr:flavin monoamine oxidase family protein [Halobacillus amylolyticus]UOR13028.1 flavin monoamine oxidase family protein [Halobacillus amylolyticus]